MDLGQEWPLKMADGYLQKEEQGEDRN